jgi:hypothetical protein
MTISRSSLTKQQARSSCKVLRPTKMQNAALSFDVKAMFSVEQDPHVDTKKMATKTE